MHAMAKVCEPPQFVLIGGNTSIVVRLPQPGIRGLTCLYVLPRGLCKFEIRTSVDFEVVTLFSGGSPAHVHTAVVAQ